MLTKGTPITPILPGAAILGEGANNKEISQLINFFKQVDQHRYHHFVDGPPDTPLTRDRRTVSSLRIISKRIRELSKSSRPEK